MPFGESGQPSLFSRAAAPENVALWDLFRSVDMDKESRVLQVRGAREKCRRGRERGLGLEAGGGRAGRGGGEAEGELGTAPSVHGSEQAMLSSSLAEWSTCKGLHASACVFKVRPHLGLSAPRPTAPCRAEVGGARARAAGGAACDSQPGGGCAGGLVRGREVLLPYVP